MAVAARSAKEVLVTGCLEEEGDMMGDVDVLLYMYKDSAARESSTRTLCKEWVWLLVELHGLFGVGLVEVVMNEGSN